MTTPHTTVEGDAIEGVNTDFAFKASDFGLTGKQIVELWSIAHHQLQKAREEVYKEVQANAEQCYRDNGRGAFEQVRAVPLYKLFTN